MYHSVKVGQRSKFAKHMYYLLKAGRPVPAGITGTLSSNQNHIAVTFDDGYISFLRNALPEIRKRRIPATLFVPTGYFSRKPDWLSESYLEFADETILTEEQLKQLPHDLITIGSHSVTHPYLANSSKEIVYKEIFDSKKSLEDILHKKITLFSLPHGSYNKYILDTLKKAGYERVFLNIPTFPSSKISEYLIGRIDISPNDWPIEYRLKLRGAYQWLPLAVFMKRKLLNFIYTILGIKQRV